MSNALIESFITLLPKSKKEVSLDLKQALCDLYEEHPFYGYRKMAKALRDQEFNVGKKRVRTLKQELRLKTMYPEPKTRYPFTLPCTKS